MRITTVAIRIIQCQHHACCSQPISKQVIQSAYPTAEDKLTMRILYIRKETIPKKKIHYFDSTKQRRN